MEMLPVLHSPRFWSSATVWNKISFCILSNNQFFIFLFQIPIQSILSLREGINHIYVYKDFLMFTLNWVSDILWYLLLLLLWETKIVVLNSLTPSHPCPSYFPCSYLFSGWESLDINLVSLVEKSELFFLFFISFSSISFFNYYYFLDGQTTAKCSI